MLASTLAVALAGNHERACSLASDISRGECNSHYSLTVFDTLRMVFEAARVHHHRAPRFSDPVRCAFYSLGSDAGHFGGALWGPGCNRFRGLLETSSVVGDKGGVGKAVAHDHVEHGHEQRQVRPRPHGQEQVGIPSNWGEAWVGDDQLCAIIARAPD